MSLSDIFVRQSIKLDLESTTRDSVLAELTELITAVHPEISYDEIFTAVSSREDKMSTGIGSGVAVPHGYCHSIGAAAGALGISRAGIDYGTLDNKPVHVLFMLVMNNTARENHLRILNQIFKLANSGSIDLIMAAKSVEELVELFGNIRF
jgi:mannitol/fructose-specific phosphotransferase system IIA component (Ntr-type)